MALLKDKLWLWGHPEGHYNNDYGNPDISRMTPLEGALYLDCSGVFMIPAGAKVNRRQYHMSFTPLKRVGWDLLRDDNGDPENGAGVNMEVVDELIEESKEFENISCGVFDDFYACGRYKKYPLEQIKKVSERLHTAGPRPLDMWMVLYTHEFGVDEQAEKEFAPYFEPFDGIIMWTWSDRLLDEFEDKYKMFSEIAKDKKRMIGLYLYAFGNKRQANPEKVLWQLDRYLELLKAGEIEGICLHTNTMADLDHEAYKVCKEWLNIHKNDVVPD